MRSEILSKEKNIIRILVEVQNESFRLKIDEAVEELRSKANIKGFRKGHVPRKVLEMHLGQDAIRAEALEKLVPEMIDKVIGEYELDIIAEPKVEVEPLVSGDPVKMTFVFETRPEVDLPEIGSIEVMKKHVQVTETMLDEAIMALRNNNATKAAINDRNSVEGDLLELEYSIIIPGEDPEAEKGNTGKQKATIELGSASVDPELNSALTGLSAGDHVEVEVPVKTGDALEEQTVHYSIDVISVSQKILPEMDEGFFQKVIGENGITHDQFRDKIREKLQENFRIESDREAEQKALAALVDKADVDLPENLVEKQKRLIIKDMEERIKKQTGQDLEGYLSTNGLERDTFEAGALKEAAATVKRTLVMEAVADQEQVKVESSDIETEIKEMSRSFGVEEAQVKQFFLKNQDNLSDLVHRIRMRKTMEILMKSAVVSEFPADGIMEQDNADDPERGES